MTKPTLAERFKIPAPEKIDFNLPILVVENQQDLRLIMVHQLNKLGIKKVFQAQHGYDALEILKEPNQKISMIIADYEMPVMGGIDLLHEVRESQEIDRPPFILTMGEPSREKIMYALENGVDEIMVKPFSFNDILPKLKSAFTKFHNPKNPEKVYELAKQKLRNEKFQEAEQIYRLISEETKKAARPLVGLARVMYRQNWLDEALKQLEEAEKRNPNFVHLYVLRGKILLDQKKTNDAISAFKKAIELSPLNPTRYEDAAKPLFAEKRFQEGIDLLNIALEHNINFPNLFNYLSEGYFALKDYKKALQNIRKALQDDPENVVYLNQLGISLKELGETEEAMKTYNSIIKLDNDNQAAYYNKAILLASQNNLDEAIKTLERILKKHPEFAAAKAKLQEYQKQKAQSAA